MSNNIKQNKETHTWIGKTITLLLELYQGSIQALSNFQFIKLIFVLMLTYGHELWVMTRATNFLT